MTKETVKKVYGLVVTFTLLSFISSLVLTAVNGYISPLFSTMFGIVLLVNASQFKKISAESSISTSSMALIAVNVVADIFYLCVLAFNLGRTFISSMS